MDYAKKKITGDFIAQHYGSENNDYPVESDSIPFDATEQVLELDLESIQILCRTGDDEMRDALVPSHIRYECGSPFRVANVEESILDFFGVKDEDQITEQMLEDAREAHQIGQDKQYLVSVQRTITKEVQIRVNASNAHQAHRLAIDAAHDIDFNLQGYDLGEPAYSANAPALKEPTNSNNFARPKERG